MCLRANARTFIIHSFFLTGISFIFYFLSFWFCKPTIEDEKMSKQEQQELSNNEEVLSDDNENVKLEVESVM